MTEPSRRRKWVRRASIASVIVIVAVILIARSWLARDASRLVKLAGSLQIGQSEADVRAVMGTPEISYQLFDVSTYVYGPAQRRIQTLIGYGDTNLFPVEVRHGNGKVFWIRRGVEIETRSSKRVLVR